MKTKAKKTKSTTKTSKVTKHFVACYRSPERIVFNYDNFIENFKFAGVTTESCGSGMMLGTGDRDVCIEITGTPEKLKAFRTAIKKKFETKFHTTLKV